MIKNISKSLLELGIEGDENSSAMIAHWDENLICQYTNQPYIDWFGVHPQATMDQMSIKDFLGPLYKQNKPFINSALKGEIQIFNRDRISPNGEVRRSIATYCPVLDGNQVKGFYVPVKDATPRNTQKLIGSIDPASDGMANVKAALEACLSTNTSFWST